MRQPGAAYLAGIGGIIAVTVALAMLLTVLFVSAVWGRWPGMATSVVGMLALNYYFLPPFYTLTIEDPKNWIALGAFFGVRSDGRTAFGTGKTERRRGRGQSGRDIRPL
jgi:two-component system sensor histidine kinase KdpD